MRNSGRTQQHLKIEEIGTTLAQCGFVALDEQAYVLGLSRSTAWTVLRGKYKSSGLSAITINSMLDTGRLPPRVRLKLLEYIAEKMSGAYGDRTHRLKAFASRISPVHMQAALIQQGAKLDAVHEAA
jgi:predicted DNA-binding transcriptional regulator AlpA